VIDYDRLTLGAPAGTADYVSFNNVRVGTLIGQGFVSCVAAWHVAHPQVVVMHGAATDNNATLFAQGYDGVLAPYFSSGKYTLVTKTADTWMPPDALTEFEGAYTAHHNINSAVIPNDETGAPIISYLQSHGVKPKTFPTTGQDATLTGLQNVLSGYQCGTVYKPIYLEAQAAVALAMYLRAGKTAPSTLVNAVSVDPTTHNSVPSVLLTPEWVTPANMNDTIVKDNFVPTAQLCSGKYAADCTAAGISTS
jgi:D-xylose transport system substrate-binding protein